MLLLTFATRRKASTFDQYLKYLKTGSGRAESFLKMAFIENFPDYDHILHAIIIRDLVGRFLPK